MAEKISTVMLKVDLHCPSCYKKINKTICKLQEREKIQTVAFDEKNNTVTVSGPFDPRKLCEKLCCKACKVIRDIQIKDKKEKDKVPSKTTCCCGSGPSYEEYYGNLQCPCCGRGYGWAPAGRPPAVTVIVHGGGMSTSNCEFYDEENPQSSCRIM